MVKMNLNGFERIIPIIVCDLRKNFFGGLQFYCKACKKIHYHGRGEGHRQSHCIVDTSPYLESGYYLILRDEDRNKMAKVFPNIYSKRVIDVEIAKALLNQLKRDFVFVGLKTIDIKDGGMKNENR